MADSPVVQDQLHEVLRRWNPWWDGLSPDSRIPRHSWVEAIRWLGEIPVLAVCGMRWCGKTTLTLQLVEHLLDTQTATPDDIVFVNLEQPVFLEDDRGDLRQLPRDVGTLERLLEVYQARHRPEGIPWVILDEIQTVDGWACWVRSTAESGRGRFILSGSSSRLLEPELATELTGRSITHTLWPLSFAEFLEFERRTDTTRVRDAGLPWDPVQKDKLESYLRIGGLPDVVLDRDVARRATRLKQYFRDIIHRDVVSRHEVRTVEKLETVAYYYLANTARLSSITSLKNKYDLATDQVRSYTEYLVECYLVGTLPRFSYKANIQQRSPHKVYATDLGIREAVAFRFSQDLGHLAETAVYNQLRRDPDSRLYYYQDTNSRTECDFVVWKGGEPHAVIQVCYTDDDQLPDREDHGLAVAMEQLDLDHGLLLTARQGARSRTLAGRTIVERSLWDWLLDGGTTV